METQIPRKPLVLRGIVFWRFMIVGRPKWVARIGDRNRCLDECPECRGPAGYCARRGCGTEGVRL